jgi:hypothetical protein
VSRVVEISTQLREWANLAGYSLTPGGTTDDGRAILWSDGGEIRHFVGIDDAGWCVVTDSDRFGPEYFTIAAPSVTTIETYFFGKFGRFIRSRNQLPRVRMPLTQDEVSSGFSITTTTFDDVDRWTLTASDGAPAAVSSGDEFSATAELAKLSLYLSATVDELMSSYLSPTGAPLFSLQQR